MNRRGFLRTLAGYAVAAVASVPAFRVLSASKAQPEADPCGDIIAVGCVNPAEIAHMIATDVGRDMGVPVDHEAFEKWARYCEENPTPEMEAGALANQLLRPATVHDRLAACAIAGRAGIWIETDGRIGVHMPTSIPFMLAARDIGMDTDENADADWQAKVMREST